MDCSISGKKFNEMYPDTTFVKLTNERMCHHGLMFKEGLIRDMNEFIPNTSCIGGLFFCKLDDAHLWITGTLSGFMYWVWDVKIPDDACVVVCDNKVKCNMFVISNPRHIWTTPEIYKVIVKRNISYCEYVVPPSMNINDIVQTPVAHLYKDIATGYITPENFETHYVRHPWLIKYLEVIDAEAVKKVMKYDFLSLKHIPHSKLTEEIIDLYLERNGYNIRFVPKEFLTEERFVMCAKHGSMPINIIPIEFRTRAVLIEAVKANPFRLINIDEKEQTEELCVIAVTKKPSVFCHVKNPTPAVKRAYETTYQEYNARLITSRSPRVVHFTCSAGGGGFIYE